MAVSPGDQLLHPEKKKTKAERDSEEDQIDSARANREFFKIKQLMFSTYRLSLVALRSNGDISSLLNTFGEIR